MSFRRFDFNLKGVEGIQERTIGGGIVTLISFIIVGFLLLSELSVWWNVEVVHRMHVDTAPVCSTLCNCIHVLILSLARFTYKSQC